jgi:hypothetical protein
MMTALIVFLSVLAAAALIWVILLLWGGREAEPVRSNLE